MAKPRILVVDDEPKIADIVESYLSNEGYAVDVALTGNRALEKLSQKDYHLIILDLMLPDIPGEEICRRVRDSWSVPIIMLTAKTAEQDLLKGFRAGTDDYITKPFSPRALTARVKALLKRSSPGHAATDRIFSFNQGKLAVDTQKHEVRKEGTSVALTPTEFRILVTFLSNPGRVFSRHDLIRCSLGDDYAGYERTIDSHIKNLRRKLGSAHKKTEYIITVHGIGYQFKGDHRALQP